MTMRLNRLDTLAILESVSPGLATRESIPQSTCVVFSGGRVWTFNDEVACSCKTKIALEGAIKAKTLLDLLSRMTEDEIDVFEQEGELIVRGKSKQAGIAMEADVLLPIDAVEQPESWAPLPSEFADAVAVVHSCASTEASQFVLTCVHVHPEWLEACDRFQMARYPLKTGVDTPILVRSEALKNVVNSGVTEVAETENWIHFRNPEGLVLSCRRYLDDYRDLSQYLTMDGTSPVTLPGGLEEVVSRCQLFSKDSADGNSLKVDLRKDMIVIEGRGPSGWYKERQKVTFGGEPLQFCISPILLLEVGKKAAQCGASEGKLCIDAGSYLYVTSTVLAKD